MRWRVLASLTLAIGFSATPARALPHVCGGAFVMTAKCEFTYTTSPTGNRLHAFATVQTAQFFSEVHITLKRGTTILIDCVELTEGWATCDRTVSAAGIPPGTVLTCSVATPWIGGVPVIGEYACNDLV